MTCAADMILKIGNGTEMRQRACIAGCRTVRDRPHEFHPVNNFRGEPFVQAINPSARPQ